jgi:ferredoxin
MVKATRKPLSEIFEMVNGYRRVLVIGCGGCVSVCLAGGQRETLQAADDLTECARQARVPQQYDCHVTERQCNPEFLQEIEDRVKDCDCLLSMACGAGAQHLADAYPGIPLFPGLDTTFVGVDRDVGLYEERCRQCGRCMLGYTGGICPVTRCSKSLFNGPCGGTRADGQCEVGDGVPCAWKDIYERLQAQGRVQSILEIRPPMDWIDKGPATLVQRGYEARYAAVTREGEGG